jgi:hypothetical protein
MKGASAAAGSAAQGSARRHFPTTPLFWSNRFLLKSSGGDMKFMDRQAATQFLREQGVKLADGALRDMASRGVGPTYAIVYGRAVYKAEALRAWLEAEAAKPLRPRRRNLPAGAGAVS